MSAIHRNPRGTTHALNLKHHRAIRETHAGSDRATRQLVAAITSTVSRRIPVEGRLLAGFTNSGRHGRAQSGDSSRAGITTNWRQRLARRSLPQRRACDVCATYVPRSAGCEKLRTWPGPGAGVQTAYYAGEAARRSCAIQMIYRPHDLRPPAHGATMDVG